MKFRTVLSGLIAATKSSEDHVYPFIDLAPVDSADSDGSYTRALEFALSNERIRNIALTGPYGSGKTSIIKTFQKTSGYRFLNISLASFKEDIGDDAAGEAQNIMIERSILQQMLYGADANKLPYSRFKRISTPVHPRIKAFLIIFWAVFTAYVYFHRGQLVTMEIFGHWYCFHLLLVSFILAIPVVLASDIYKSTFGMSFKKLSLKNAEIEIGDVTENSILNRHLDEIIYFFQSTEYEVVVIEDLDRFGSPEIFVKLREINKIINDNEKINRNIKFLYALKDDMFEHKSRAKFFDFIIPVVPIINTSNSLDMMQERIKNEPFEKDIDAQFLREVSLYIDDLRLIHNIFNEFYIYRAKLSSESLNLTKLLAMMIYKNVYPNDFESLHNGCGAVHEVTHLRPKLIAETRLKFDKEVSSIRSDIVASENETANNVQELIKMFIGHLVSSVEQPIRGVYSSNNQLLLLSELKTLESFEQLPRSSNIDVGTQQGYRTGLGKSLSQLESELTPTHTLKQRKEYVENKTASRRIELQIRIDRIEKKKATISQTPLHKLLEEQDISVEEIFSKHGVEDHRLVVYLLKNGYLDENYHLYTSNFHEGRLSNNDRDFLLTIRDFQKPDPKHPIDTPDEVCQNMRVEDFGHKYVLNVRLIDFLLVDTAKGQQRIQSAVNYISENFADAEDFFAAYWEGGNNVETFVRAVCERWPDYAFAAAKSLHAPKHISLVLRWVDPKYVSDDMNREGVLTKYLSEHGHLIFASEISSPDNFTALKRLETRFVGLRSLLKNKLLLDFIHNEALYEINAENIAVLLELYPSAAGSHQLDPTTANYSAIKACGSDLLNKYVEANLSYYISNVFLALPCNTNESISTIKELLRAETISTDLKHDIILKQDMKIANLDSVPANLWAFIMSNGKIETSWRNISEYLMCEECEKEVVTHLLEWPDSVDVLTVQRIEIEEIGEASAKSLSGFIVQNDDLSDSIYAKYLNCLPYIYFDFPSGISQPKMQALAKARKVQLNEKSFSTVGSDEVLLSFLLASNIDVFLRNKDGYPIVDTVRERLLSFDIAKETRAKICQDVTPSGVKASKKLTRYVADVLKLPEVDCGLFDKEVTSHSIVHALTIDDSMRILVKCIPNWDKSLTMEILGQLPAPFCEIPLNGKRPKIPKSSINLLFAKLLESHGLVSSVTEEERTVKINTFKSTT